MESGTRARIVSVAVLLVVLSTGFVLGLAWARTSGSLRADVPPSTAKRSPHAAAGKPDRHKLIVDGVGLSAVERQEVDSIVEGYRGRLDEMQRQVVAEFGPRHRALLQAIRDDIRGVLTPEQQTRYDTLLARHDRRVTDAWNARMEKDSAEGAERR